MNEKFIELKDDLKNILNQVNKNPKYYYKNWIEKIINEKKSKHEDIARIFKRWTDSPIKNTISEERYKEITEISILKLTTLLTDLNNNKDLAVFLCTVYDCVDHVDYLEELFSNEFQNQKFKELYENQVSEEINYDKGILIDDNLGLIKKAMVNPEAIKIKALVEQVETLVKKEWTTIGIVDKVVKYKNTRWVRNYIELDKVGYIKHLKVLDGQVMADVNMHSGHSKVLLSNEDYPDQHKDLILRPVYIVDGVGMVSKVDQSQTDNVIMIAGFDICANKNKEDNE